MRQRLYPSRHQAGEQCVFQPPGEPHHQLVTGWSEWHCAYGQHAVPVAVHHVREVAVAHHDQGACRGAPKVGAHRLSRAPGLLGAWRQGRMCGSACVCRGWKRGSRLGAHHGGERVRPVPPAEQPPLRRRRRTGTGPQSCWGGSDRTGRAASSGGDVNRRSSRALLVSAAQLWGWGCAPQDDSSPVKHGKALRQGLRQRRVHSVQIRHSQRVVLQPTGKGERRAVRHTHCAALLCLQRGRTGGARERWRVDREGVPCRKRPL